MGEYHVTIKLTTAGATTLTSPQGQEAVRGYVEGSLRSATVTGEVLSITTVDERHAKKAGLRCPSDTHNLHCGFPDCLDANGDCQRGR